MCDRVDTARQSIADGWVSLKRGESIIIEYPDHHLP